MKLKYENIEPVTEEHFRKLERMYLSSPFNRFFEPQMNIFKGCTELRIKVRPEFFHAAHALHGSIYYKALDDSSYFAVSSLVTDVFIYTINYNLYLTKSVKSGELIAQGKVVHQSKSLFVAESELTDDQGLSIGRGSGCFMRSSIPLSPDVGYF